MTPCIEHVGRDVRTCVFNGEANRTVVQSVTRMLSKTHYFSFVVFCAFFSLVCGDVDKIRESIGDCPQSLSIIILYPHTRDSDMSNLFLDENGKGARQDTKVSA